MKFVDFVTKLFFGKLNSDGFYQAEQDVTKDSYILTSIFPNEVIEKKILKTR